ncbi:hypothetical protein ACQVP2_20895 [Methylobacterium aquaticum]|uniref:hypothetical protein n=1 Tax=Methylobacterium aquaticum TaxID=270351 RepID=UPI003D176064
MKHEDFAFALKHLEDSHSHVSFNYEIWLASGDKIIGLPELVEGKRTLFRMEGGDPTGPIYFNADDVVAVQLTA